MNAKEIRNQRVATQEYLNSLDKALMSEIHAAIRKAEEEIGNYHFRGLRDWLRSPFGIAPTASGAYDTIMQNAASTNETEYVYENVLMGAGNKHGYPVEEWKLIAKYLNA